MATLPPRHRRLLLTEPEQMHAIYIEELDESVSDESDEEMDEEMGEDADPFDDPALVRISPLDVEPWPRETKNTQTLWSTRTAALRPSLQPHATRTYSSGQVVLLDPPGSALGSFADNQIGRVIRFYELWPRHRENHQGCYRVERLLRFAYGDLTGVQLELFQALQPNFRCETYGPFEHMPMQQRQEAIGGGGPTQTPGRAAPKRLTACTCSRRSQSVSFRRSQALPHPVVMNAATLTGITARDIAARMMSTSPTRSGSQRSALDASSRCAPAACAHVPMFACSSSIAVCSTTHNSKCLR